MCGRTHALSHSLARCHTRRSLRALFLYSITVDVAVVAIDATTGVVDQVQAARVATIFQNAEQRVEATRWNVARSLRERNGAVHEAGPASEHRVGTSAHTHTHTHTPTHTHTHTHTYRTMVRTYIDAVVVVVVDRIVGRKRCLLALLRPCPAW